MISDERLYILLQLSFIQVQRWVEDNCGCTQMDNTLRSLDEDDVQGLLNSVHVVGSWSAHIVDHIRRHYPHLAAHLNDNPDQKEPWNE